MEQAVKVAVVRSDNRRGAVAQALALLAPELAGVVTDRVLIKPNLVSHRRQLPSTHAETLSAVVDAVRAGGASHITVAEGASDASAGFDHFGYRRALWGQPVSFFDINRDETAWDTVELASLRGEPLVARVSATVTRATCRVSVALAKTHVTSGVTFGMKNMLSSIHPADRIMMHGYPGGGNGYAGWKRLLVDFLKGDNLAVNVLTRTKGRAKLWLNRWQGKDGPGGWMRFSKADLGFLRSVEAMNRNLAALTARVGPNLSVVDGFMAMHREGPRHGTPIRLGTVVAGLDPVAVDAVAAAVMGFDPRQIGYLHHAERAGLGIADLDAITVVGDPIELVRRRCVPHSNFAVQQHWARLVELESGPPRTLAFGGPHTRPRPRASEVIPR